MKYEYRIVHVEALDEDVLNTLGKDGFALITINNAIAYFIKGLPERD